MLALVIWMVYVILTTINVCTNTLWYNKCYVTYENLNFFWLFLLLICFFTGLIYWKNDFFHKWYVYCKRTNDSTNVAIEPAQQFPQYRIDRTFTGDWSDTCLSSNVKAEVLKFYCISSLNVLIVKLCKSFLSEVSSFRIL